MVQKNLSRLMVVLATVFLPGCIAVLVTGEVYDRVPDPQEHRFVTGTQVGGRTITLADGRQFQLAGVDVDGLDAEQLTAFEAGLSKVVGCKQLLVSDEQGTTAVITMSGGYIGFPWETFPTIILFPVHMQVPPARIDVGYQLVAQGLAKVDESEISDQARLVAYRDAEERARRCHIGVWRTDAERLCDAAAQGRLEAVRTLTDAGVSVNGVGYTKEDATRPLITAAAKGRDEVVSYLLAKGAEAGAQDGHHQTALNAAAASGHAGVVSQLIAAGVDLDVRWWSSPLEDAVSGGHVDVVKLLLQAGAKMDNDRGDDTALFKAARDGRIEIVKLLVEHGARVNAANRDGDTPLLVASGNGHEAVVEYLIGRGADVNAKDHSSYTPHKLARQNYHEEVLRLLEKAGGHD